MTASSKEEARLLDVAERLEKEALERMATFGCPEDIDDIANWAASEIREVLATLPPQHSSGDARELIKRLLSSAAGFEKLPQERGVAALLREAAVALSRQDRPEGVGDATRCVDQLVSAVVGTMMEGGKPAESEWVSRAKADLLASIAALGSQPRPPQLREVLEAVRARGWTRDEAHRIVDDVFDNTIVNFDDEAQAEVTLGLGERSGPDDVTKDIETLRATVLFEAMQSATRGRKLSKYEQGRRDLATQLVPFVNRLHAALASRSAPDGWMLALEGLRSVFDEADMPELAVEPDERVGMEWNDHITYADDPNMRVAFMSNAHFSNERAAAIVAAVNFVRQALAASPSALSGEGVDNG